MIFVHLWLTQEGIPISVWARPRSVACFCFAAWCLWCPCVWSSLMFKLLPTQPPMFQPPPPIHPLAVIRIIIVQFICCFIVEVSIWSIWCVIFTQSMPPTHHPSPPIRSPRLQISVNLMFSCLCLIVDEYWWVSIHCHFNHVRYLCPISSPPVHPIPPIPVFDLGTFIMIFWL